MSTATHFMTPEGRANLVDGGDYGWGADVVAVHFRADPDRLQRLLPGSLRVDEGRCTAYVGRFHNTSAQRPRAMLDNPGAAYYEEAALTIACTHGERRGNFPAFVWVSREFSLVRGWLNGYPKKLGDVSFARPHALNPVTGGVAQGAVAAGICSRNGFMLLRVGIDVEAQGTAADLRGRPSTFGHRSWPALDPTQTAVSEIVEVNRSDLRVADVWTGKPHLTLGEAPDEELDWFQPLSLEGAVLYSYGFRIAGARVIERLEPSMRQRI